MPRRQKRTTSVLRQTPNLAPYYYPYSQYGYIPPTPTPFHHHQYVDPYMYYPPANDDFEYIYYPIDQYGQITGPPVSFPPIVPPPHHHNYPYPSYVSNRSVQGSHRHSPKRDHLVYENYYSPRHPHSRHSHHQSRQESLPPIQRHPFAHTRPVSSDVEEHQQFAVHDLTERGSTSSIISQHDAIAKVRHYDKLRRSYR